MSRIPDPPAAFPAYDDGVPLPCGCGIGTNASGPAWCAAPSVAWRWVAGSRWLAVCRKHAKGRTSWPTPSQCKAAGQPHRRPTPKAKGPSLTQQRAKCDRLFAAWVRSSGPCAAEGWGPGDSVIQCSDRLQCAHIISRKEFGVRWNPLNALCLCSAHHSFFTHAPLRWEIWRDDYLGEGLYAALRDKALAYVGPPDYRSILADLVLLVEGT